MSTFNCKMCGGTLEIKQNATIATCDYCGTQQTLPKLTDEKRASLYERANHFRRNNDFDKAMAIYEQILNEDQTDAEAYWSLVLCQYGIEYVEDPLSHRRIPTVNRVQFTSIFDDDNYKSALKHADMYQRRIYEEEAKAINEIQKGILAISQKEEPFDVFICYKETDAIGKRTQDSVLAQDLYYQLTQEGFKVFFARITLEDKLGSAYEPYIFAALNSAKVMVVLGTKPEHFNAVWVKNEWSRYLALVKNSKGQKMLIPAYRGMDPYDLPEEFSHLQAQDMSKLGFMQDLIRGIKKILGKDKKPAATVTERVVVQSDGGSKDTAPLLRRAHLFLEDGEFDSADEYAEKVLDIDPECAEAYVVKLLVELRLKKQSDLPQYKTPISTSNNYQKAIRFASSKYREELEGYNNAIIKRAETARKDGIYANGVEAMRYHHYDEAIASFQNILSYKDSAQRIEDCKRLKEEERLNGIYQRAIQLMNGCAFENAISLFQSIENYKDSQEKIKLCREKQVNARKDAIYRQAMAAVDFLSTRKPTDEDFKKCIAQLQTISGYKDADDQIRALNSRLEKWYEDKRKAEEAARIRAEEERRTRERLAEERRIKAERAKAKAKKVAKVGIPSAAVLALVLILLFNLVIPTIRHNQADELLNAGKYDEAMEIYQELGGFYESEQRIAIIKGTNYVSVASDTEGDAQIFLFNTGISQILNAGTPVKITYGMYGGDFSGTAYVDASQDEDDLNIVIANASAMPNITSPLSAPADVPETVEFGYNSSADFAGIQTPSKQGYRFVKWELESYSYQVDGIFELKLNAVWSEKEYTISYDLGGGSLSAANRIEYGIEDYSFTLNNPTKTGYTFIGWTGTDLSEPTLSVTIPTGSVGNRSYKANWEANTYTITLNPNGGTVSTKSITVTYGKAFTLPTPEWTGRNFSGWYEGSKKVTSGTWTRTSDLSLTTQWDVVEYGITYNLNGGVNSQSNPSIYTILDEFTLVAPTRTGYTFTGWTGTDLSEPTMVVVIDDCIGNRSYAANWTANTNTITLDSNGGAVSYEPITVTYDQSYTLPTPTRTGYTFAGWYNGNTKYSSGTWKGLNDLALTAKWNIITYSISYTMNGGTNPSSNPTTYNVEDVISLAQPTKIGYTFAGWIGTDLSEPTMILTFGNLTGNRSYTATWTANTYIITLDANGGEVEDEPITATYDQEYTLPTPTRTGYTFEGWFSGTTEYTSGTWTRLEDVALVAEWTVNKYAITYADTNEVLNNVVVTFDYNYSDSIATTVTLTNGEHLGYPTVSTRSGYAFAGWYTDSSCTTQYSFSGTITEDITLYAKWVAMTSTYSSREYVDIANYNTYSSSKLIEISTSSSSSSQNYYYFTCYKTGSYKLNAEYTSGDFYITVYNVMKETTILSASRLYAGVLGKSVSFTANAGDVIYVSLYKYSSSSTSGTGIFHVTNAGYPTNTAIAKSSSIVGLTYGVDSTIENVVAYDENFTLPTPTRTGYTFGGWYNGDTKIESGIWNYTTDITLTALWTANTYIVTYDANGGECGVISEDIVFDESYTLPTPTRTGYTFAGWFSGTTEYTGGTWNELADVTLVAKWKANTYVITYEDTVYFRDSVTVTFAHNYSGSTSTTSTLKNGQTLSRPTDPMREGYVFIGWYTDSSCTTVYDFAGTITDDMTLYAGWAEMSMPNAYSEVQINPLDYTSNSSSGRYSVATSGTSAGYRKYIYLVAQGSCNGAIWFSGGSSTKVCYYIEIHNLTTGTLVGSTTVLSSSTRVYGVDCSKGDIIVISLYSDSQWQPDAYLYFADFPKPKASTAIVSCPTITGHFYDDTAQYVDSVDYDEDYTLPTPTRTGYTFGGWYNGDTKIESGIWNYTTDMTLTALWTAATYTITLDPNDGEIEDDSITVTYDQSYTLPTPTRTGFDFAGWYNGTKRYASGKWKDASNVTLTAKWIPKEYVITYDNYGPLKTTVTVTFDHNYSGSTPTTSTLSNDQTLSRPTDPVREGYVFTGWYTDSSCTTQYTFTGTITEDMTLYAGWVEMSMPSVYSQTQIVPGNYSSTSKTYSVSTSGTSIDSQHHIYLVAEETGTHYIYYKNSDTTLYSMYNLGIRNLTTGTSILSTSKSDIDYSSQSFTCSKGDVIVVSLYRYSSAVASSNAYLYFVGFSSPATSTAKVEYNTEPFGYIEGESYSTTVTFGTLHQLPVLTKTGYTVVWYNGEEKVESGGWIIPSDVTLTPRWQINSYTITFVTNGGEQIDDLTQEYQSDLTLPDPVRDGYTFGGWFTDAKLTTAFAENTMPLDGATVYAWWTEENKPTDFSYSETSTAITVSAYTGSETTVAIPSHIGGVPVTSIGKYAFQGCTNLTSITIPNSVTSIAYGAFQGCTKLTSVTISDGVKSIGELAFYNCTGLTSITIPESIISIGEDAFRQCYKLTSVTISDGVKAIDDYAFYYCSSLTSIIIPDSVTSIGIGAFYMCDSLTSITLPYVGVAHFGYIFGASDYSENWRRVPDSLKTVVITGGSSIPNYAFYGFDSLSSITIPDSVTSIGHSAFYGCDSLKSITIPDSVTSIGSSAFYNCSSLTSVTIGSSVTSIGEYAFRGCSGLTSITIPASVTAIGRLAFCDCTELTSVTFEDPNGWYCTSTQGETTEIYLTLTDSSQNATYLKDTYYGKYWYK